jgi:lipopolysaccharide/colanic/teichoic acid biosynthesis glycosyltransferase
MRCLVIAGWRCARFSQTKNIAVRLMVRPGITGWAQVNGGVLLSRDNLDENAYCLTQ